MKKVQFVEIMPFKKKNVIIIMIDALRYDRLLNGGYKYNLTPNLNKIIKDSFFLKNHFANGCPTSVSFPSIFTSTFPLDYGGYNLGIKNRPKTFSEIFSKNGYDTFGVTSAHPSGNHFYYNRGFRIYENLLDFYQWFRQNLKVYLREDLIKFKNNEISKNDILKSLSLNYSRILFSTIEYISQFEKIGLVGKNFDISKNKNKIYAEIEILKKNPEIILKKFLTYDYLYYLFFGENKISKPRKFFIKIKENLRTKINNIVNIFPRRKIYPANEIFDRYKNYISNNEGNKEKKHIAFIHLFDVHEAKNFIFKFSFSYLFNMIKLIFIRKFKFGGLIYDLSVLMVDKEIGNFFQYLKKKNFLESSNVIFTSDHGLTAGHPIRPKTKQRTDLSQKFYDEFIHVPLIIYPKFALNLDTNNITSHIDFAPTLLDLCNLNKEKSFKGESIFNLDHKNKYIISENTGSGICDVKNKNIYICLRSKKLKITYECINQNVKERDVFDIINDPLETKNLVSTKISSIEREYYLNQAKMRLKTIQDYV